MTLESPPYKYYGFSYTSTQDLQDQRAEDRVYELFPGQSVIHSENCQQLIGCTCTRKEISDRLEEEWRKKIQELHKGRNARVRARKQLQQEQEQRDNWNPLGMEDFET